MDPNHKNSFIVAGIYYPNKYTFENVQKIQKNENLDDYMKIVDEKTDKAFFIPDDVIKELKIEHSFISSDDNDAHGLEEKNEFGNYRPVSQPSKSGKIIGKMRDEKNNNIVVWLTDNDENGIKQAMDIIKKEKRSLSLQHDTTPIFDPVTKELKQLEFIANHIALLPKDMKPGREGSEVKFITPLYPEHNEYMDEINQIIKMEKIKIYNQSQLDLISEINETKDEKG